MQNQNNVYQKPAVFLLTVALIGNALFSILSAQNLLPLCLRSCSISKDDIKDMQNATWLAGQMDIFAAVFWLPCQYIWAWQEDRHEERCPKCINTCKNLRDSCKAWYLLFLGIMKCMIVLVVQIQTWSFKKDQNTIYCIAVLQMSLYIATLFTHGLSLRAFFGTLKAQNPEDARLADLANVARLANERAATANAAVVKADADKKKAADDKRKAAKEEATKKKADEQKAKAEKKAAEQDKKKKKQKERKRKKRARNSADSKSKSSTDHSSPFELKDKKSELDAHMQAEQAEQAQQRQADAQTEQKEADAISDAKRRENSELAQL